MGNPHRRGNQKVPPDFFPPITALLPHPSRSMRNPVALGNSSFERRAPVHATFESIT
jgi:hypothetical protein